MSLSRPTMSAIRFGYGIRPGDTLPDGPDDLLAQLRQAASEPVRYPAEGIEGRRQAIRENMENAREARVEDRTQRRKNMRKVLKQVYAICASDQHDRMAQSSFSPFGFHERLVTFWADHFSISCRKSRGMYLYAGLYEAEALRPNLAGPFRDFLKAAILHPAMLTYLDQVRSKGPNSPRGNRTGKGLNENLGRELLELHTLGVDGGYSQKDVRDAALMLTGLAVSRATVTADFRPQIAEPGPLTFMGKTYGGARRTVADIESMLDDLADRPQTAQHICRKLVVHFVSDTPPAALVQAMTDAWKRSDGDLFEVYSAMLNHPAAWDEPGQKARQPYDFIVAGIRALQIPEQSLAMHLQAAGQDKATQDDMSEANDMAQADDMAEADDGMDTSAATDMNRKVPKGNPFGKDDRWLNRLSVGAVRKLGQPVWEPTSPAGFDEAFSAWITSAQITGRIAWAQLVASEFGGRESPDAFVKAILRDAARDDTLRIVSQAPSKPAGLALALASPEFNRR